MTQEGFRRMCILSGCDYLPNHAGGVEAAKAEASLSWGRIALHASRIGAGGSLLQKTTRVGLA